MSVVCGWRHWLGLEMRNSFAYTTISSNNFPMLKVTHATGVKTNVGNRESILDFSDGK